MRSTLHFFDESSDGVLDQVQTAEALIAMESFTRAVEIVLRDSLLRDALTYRPDEALWAFALRQSGYVQATSGHQPCPRRGCPSLRNCAFRS